MKLLGPSMLFAAAIGLAPEQAAAQLTSEWVGQWELDPQGPDKCVVKRVHAGGTRILVYGKAGGIRTLIVDNPAWPAASAGSLDQLVSLRRGERLPLPPDGRKVELDADMAARVVASDAIEVVRPDGSVLERVDLSGIAAAEARLPGCMARVAKHSWNVVPPPMMVAPRPPVLPPPDWMGLGRPGLERPATAKIPLQTLYSDEDYPSAAIRAGEQGSVAFRISIGSDGRVTGCVIIASSGSESLDSATCRLLADRAVFWPARDRSGKPAADSLAGRIVWRLPASEPLAPPPTPPPS